MPVSAPSDRRFRRAHVTPARRTRFLRMSWRIAVRAALVLTVLAPAGYYVARQVLAADALTISRIIVTGNSRLSKGEVVALLDGIRGVNMLTIDLDVQNQALRRAEITATIGLETPRRQVGTDPS